MRFSACCAAALLSLPLLAQQKGGGPSAAKVPIPKLTAEGYRDLIVNTTDAVTLASYISPGTRLEYFNGRQRDCIMTFTFSESAAQDITRRRKVWANARVPNSLQASHAEILKWIGSFEAKARRVPKCFEPLLQASEEQFGFLEFLGEYDDLRKNAATALKGLGVTLPPNANKSTPNKE